MPPRLVQFIAGGETCVVATVDETGRPNTTLMTWVVARNPQTLAMAVDQRSRTIKNVRANGRVAIEVLGDDLCYGLRGTAVIEKETMTSAPFPCALLIPSGVRGAGAIGGWPATRCDPAPFGMALFIPSGARGTGVAVRSRRASDARGEPE